VEPNGSLRFGFEIPAHPGDDGREPYRLAYETCQLAEELGFDFGFLPHHRFTAGFPSAPLIVLAAIASRTSALRVGTGIFLLPTHHPLDVAEQIAQLDEVSGGRVIFTAGLGYRPYEFEPLGLPFAARGSLMEEGLEVLRLVLSQEDASYAGNHYAFEHVTVHPRPTQRPRPPVWVGANRRVAVERAARLADGWFADFMQTGASLAPTIAIYREIAAQQLGGSSTLCLMRHVHVAATQREVEEGWLPGVQAFYRDVWEGGSRWPDPEGTMPRLLAGEALGLREFAHDRLIAGTPDDCIEAITRLHAVTGCDSLFVGLRAGTGSHARGAGAVEDTREQLRRFGQEVIPAFRP